MKNIRLFISLLSIIAISGLFAGFISPVLAASQPTVSTNNVLYNGSYSVTMYGAVNPNDLPTTAWFEYGTTENLGMQTPSQSISGIYVITTSATVNSLQANTSYYFRAVAENSLGRVNGPIHTFTTYGTGGSTCAVPYVTTGTATVNGTSVTLFGTVNSNNTANLRYFFEYGTSQSLGQTTFSQTMPSGYYIASQVQTTITNLSSSNTTYYYRLVVQNECGSQQYGQILSFVSGTYNQNPTYPYYPYNPTYPTYGLQPTVTTKDVLNRGDNSLTFYGEVNPNGSATYAWFEFGRTSGLGSTLPSKFVGDGSGNAPRSTMYIGLASGTRYYYRLVARNSSGISYGSILSAVTSGTAPSNGSGSSGSSGSSGGNGDNGGTGNTVVKPTSTIPAAGSPILVATPEFSDDAVKTGDKFDYVLTIRNNGNASAKNVIVTITIPVELEYVESNPGIFSRTANIHSFSLGEINAGEEKRIEIGLKANKDVSADVTVQITAAIDYENAAGEKQASSASRTISVGKKARSVFAAMGGAFGRIWNIPGYIWFFIFLLAMIVFVTWMFFRKIRGSEPENMDETRSA